MRRLALVTAGLLVAVACGGKQAVFLDDQPGPDASPAAFELPDPVPASPAWVVSLPRPASKVRLQKAGNTPGVAVLAPVSRKSVVVKGPAGKQRLRVASVDPLAFRSVAPASTRDAAFVWTALLSDRAVITFEAAQKLGVKGSEELAIGNDTVQVGAFADNGIPNIADILLPPRIARRLHLGGPRLLVVGAKTGVTIEALGRDLKKRLPGARLRRIRPELQPSQPSTPQPTGTVSGATIGTMQFRILQNGFIDPDPAWVSANITTANVPVLGSVQCHRIMIPQLAAALQEVVDAGLSSEIRPGEYAGCYVPRFIDRDPRRGLSMHAFGLAVDFNVSTNGLGTRGDMDPGVVQIFQKWGFTWGGVWSRPDPMHFELARIVR